MIEGRFLASKHAAWKRKSDAVLAFKNSEYWSWIVDGLKNNNLDQVEETRYGRYWKYKSRGKEIEDKKYQELLDNETVKYIEITPIPEWTNL
jgi:hypothetical protein